MKFTALVRSVCGRPTLDKIMGPLQVGSFQHHFIPRDPKAKPKRYKFPEFYDPYGSRLPTSEKIVQLAERIAALSPEELCQVCPTLQYKLKHPEVQIISMDRVDLTPEGGTAKGAAKVKEKQKTAFEVKLEKFDASSEN